MRHYLLILLVFACFAALFLGCFYPVFFSDRQFGFRDAAHYYYPLYQRVQKEWDEGRWPLWEPEENAGMPLLGNPTAAVLYPGKLIYAALPYAWGARVYIVAHSVLAFMAMLVLMRSWHVSWTGSGLAAMAYAFGVPILFQSCNVIFLVGAAWLPLGFRAVDRWVRLGRRWGMIELAVVLAMQTLGGDPQVAYLLGLSAFGYAAGLAWQRGSSNSPSITPDLDSRSRGSFGWAWLLIVALGVVGWVVVTLIMAQWLPTMRPKSTQPPAPVALPWMRHVPTAVLGVWMAAALGFVVFWRRRGRRFPLGLTLLGLIGSAAMAIALSAAQLFPVFEFTQQTSRAAAAGPHDIYPFSIEPQKLSGLLWPNAMGVLFEGNTFWGDLLRLPGTFPKTWVPSLYMGSLILVLGTGALRFRREAPWRVWLSLIFAVSLVLSLGQYTSPIWAARVLAKLTNLPLLQDLVREIGPLDSEDATPIRIDRYMRDGDGSIYWWVATILPGFRQFRFPAKLFTFGSLALAALAGLGWDGLREGGTRRITAFAAALVALSLAVLVGVLIERPAILEQFRGFSPPSSYGPFDPDGGYAALVRALLQTSIVLSLGLLAVRLARTRPLWAGALALVVTTGDLAAANIRFVLTVPQALFESTPEVVRLLQEAERAKPTPGPFRVHRMPIWELLSWGKSRSTERNNDLVNFERNTIQPKYGINYGIEYAHTLGVAELYDYEWYYGGFPRKVHNEETARVLNVEVDKEVVYFPRRTFDMWNARYFIVPMHANGWRDEFRGFATFLQGSERVYPPPEKFRGSESQEEAREWVENHDFQIRRNLNEHPRAWVVHNARTLAPTAGLSTEERRKAMQEIVYSDDGFWSDRSLTVYDPLQLAWVEKDQILELGPYLPDLHGGARRRSEPVKVSYPNPQRVEIEADLERPGIVVLADVYYPGWELTIEGKPAPIYPVNRLMRGAAVPAGRSHLVYTYSPRSFRVGRVVSLSGLGVLALLALVFSLRPVDPIVGPQPQPAPREPRSDEKT
jgi:hypothetical protein